MRIDDQWLRVGVADHADALPAVKPDQFGLELGTEVAVFNIVNGAMEPVPVAHGHASALGSQMGVIVSAVVQIRHTIRLRDNSEKTAHDDLYCCISSIPFIAAIHPSAFFLPA